MEIKHGISFIYPDLMKIFAPKIMNDEFVGVSGN